MLNISSVLGHYEVNTWSHIAISRIKFPHILLTLYSSPCDIFVYESLNDNRNKN